MTNQAIDVRATFVGPMQFDVTSATGHTIPLDVPEADGGLNRGPTPMELLLMGLAGCTGMDVISILAKKRQVVTAYEIRVSGIRAEKHPKVYVDVTVEHIVTGRHVDPQAVRRAVELSEATYCGVSKTIEKTARITTTFQVREAEPSSSD
jgi:putative redox protein